MWEGRKKWWKERIKKRKESKERERTEKWEREWEFCLISLQMASVILPADLLPRAWERDR